jgi:23S rRNA pseudouridine1911/1915/1917 synthase
VVDAVTPAAVAPACPEVVYEDNHVVVAVKPPGVLSQPDGSPAPDMLALLKADIKARHGKPGDVFLGLVHRLDRPVGGLMAFGRTSKGASRLSAQIRDHAFDKRYLAVVHGRPPQDAGELTARLRKDAATNVVRRVDLAGTDAEGDVEDDDGTGRAVRDASLAYRVLGTTTEARPLSLLEISLETGRGHQIRVQLADAGIPIVGDHKYGLPDDDVRDIALWSFRLGFDAPTRPERLVVQVPPPAGRTPWNRFAALLPPRVVPPPPVPVPPPGHPAAQGTEARP